MFKYTEVFRIFCNIKTTCTKFATIFHPSDSKESIELGEFELQMMLLIRFFGWWRGHIHNMKRNKTLSVFYYNINKIYYAAGASISLSHSSFIIATQHTCYLMVVIIKNISIYSVEVGQLANPVQFNRNRSKPLISFRYNKNHMR